MAGGVSAVAGSKGIMVVGVMLGTAGAMAVNTGIMIGSAGTVVGGAGIVAGSVGSVASGTGVIVAGGLGVVFGCTSVVMGAAGDVFGDRVPWLSRPTSNGVVCSGVQGMRGMGRAAAVCSDGS